jgi:hypothetical protein
MRGFRGFLGISGRRFGNTIPVMVFAGAALLISGCSGFVAGKSSGTGIPLTISGVAAANATVTGVVVDWQTSAAANSQVEFGTTSSYGSITALDSTMVTSHQESLAGLKPATLYHYRVHSTDVAGTAAVSGDQSFTTAADTTPPTVSISSPTANATLSRTVNVTATATDDVAVASVQFKVDNANTGSAVTAAPYSYSLNTTTLSDGNHVLTAVATDTSGNAATSAGVPVKVNNSAPAPSITSLSPTSGLVGASVTVTGANFGAAQGTSTVTFNGVTAIPTNWSASSIVVPVPTGATTGNVVVTVGGIASNGVSFTVTVPAPSITSLSPTSGLVGASVTVTGANFGAAQGTSTVTFNGITAIPTNWSASSIVVPVPAGATTGNVVATVGGVASNGLNFTVTVPVPSITSLNPTSGLVGASVTISGANFGATQGTSTVKFNGITATPTSWSATSIVAPVPASATTGNVVVTVGGVASNGVSFTVTPDTVPPTVSVTAPVNGATVSGSTVTLSATASDNVGVTGVQFQVDSANVGALLTAAPYSVLWDSTSVANGSHTITAVAQDAAGNHATSVGVTVTVSNTSGTPSMGPLVQSSTNSHYFVDPAGQAVYLSGSHTWTSFQDLGNAGATVATDFNAYVSFLKAHGHNVTILWRKDLPQFCNWGAGGIWLLDTTTGMPWVRSSTQGASDGGNKFDLNTFNQPYFDRLRARALQLQQNGIYAIVQLFDGLQLTNARCGTTAPTGDGYPLTGVNNINGVDDGYTSGTGGVSSMTMSAPNAITAVQDAYVKKVVDTLNDLPNVVWEISEEGPTNEQTFWAGHLMGLLRAYEGGGTFEGSTYTAKPFKHPVGWPTTQYPGNDSTLYASTADWIAPTLSGNLPAVVQSNNQGKLVINDSDHSAYYTSFLNTDGTVKNQALRAYAWENFTSGAAGVIFMDPYEVYWAGSVRNSCTPANPAHGVCTGVDTKYDSFRNTLGYVVSYASSQLDLVKMTPQGSLSSTGYCLAQTPTAGAEYLVYAPNGGTFTVNLSAMPSSRSLNVEWFNPATGVTTPSGTVTAGVSNQSFSAPFSGDAVLYLVDTAGHK